MNRNVLRGDGCQQLRGKKGRGRNLLALSSSLLAVPSYPSSSFTIAPKFPDDKAYVFLFPDSPQCFALDRPVSLCDCGIQQFVQVECEKTMDAYGPAHRRRFRDCSRYSGPCGSAIIRFPEPADASRIRQFRCGHAEQRNALFHDGAQSLNDLLFGACSHRQCPRQKNDGRSR